MADVSVPVPAPFGDGDDPGDVESRAQLILITGLTLAVLFVAVVLLLNTVIYTENLATRGIDSGGGEAVEFREGTVTDVAGIMHREHRNEGSENGVAADFEASVDVYADGVRDHRIRDGVVADVDARVVDEGHFIAQDPFENGSYRALVSDDAAGAEGDWAVANNVTQTRNYLLVIDPDSLSNESEAFTATADGSEFGIGEVWSLTVYEDPGEDDVALEVDGTWFDGTSNTFEVADGEDIRIDLTAGTVNGDPWEPLRWADGVQEDGEPYDIEYENGDNAEGTYHLVVDGMDGSGFFEEDPYGDEPANRSSQPYVVDAVYSADVDVYHRTPELEYGDTVRVAPGERDD